MKKHEEESEEDAMAASFLQYWYASNPGFLFFWIFMLTTGIVQRVRSKLPYRAIPFCIVLKGMYSCEFPNRVIVLIEWLSDVDEKTTPKS